MIHKIEAPKRRKAGRGGWQEAWAAGLPGGGNGQETRGGGGGQGAGRNKATTVDIEEITID